MRQALLCFGFPRWSECAWSVTQLVSNSTGVWTRAVCLQSLHPPPCGTTLKQDVRHKVQLREGGWPQIPSSMEGAQDEKSVIPWTSYENFLNLWFTVCEMGILTSVPSSTPSLLLPASSVITTIRIIRKWCPFPISCKGVRSCPTELQHWDLNRKKKKRTKAINHSPRTNSTKS